MLQSKRQTPKEKRTVKRTLWLTAIGLIVFMGLIFAKNDRDKEKLKHNGTATIGCVKAHTFHNNRSNSIYSFTVNRKEYPATYSVYSTKKRKHLPIGQCDTILYLPSRPHINKVILVNH